jgi:HEAT repeat protein
LIKLGDRRAIGPLIDALRDKDVAVHMDAARGLGYRSLRDPRAVEPLISALGDGNCAAAESLGLLGDSRAIPPLISVLADPNPYVRKEAAKALARLGESHWQRHVLGSDHSRDLERVGQWGDVRALGALLGALKDKDKYVRSAAAGALAELGDPRAIGPLTEAKEHHDSWCQSNVAEALKELHAKIRAQG